MSLQSISALGNPVNVRDVDASTGWGSYGSWGTGTTPVGGLGTCSPSIITISTTLGPESCPTGTCETPPAVTITSFPSCSPAGGESTGAPSTITVSTTLGPESCPSTSCESAPPITITSFPSCTPAG